MFPPHEWILPPLWESRGQEDSQGHILEALAEKHTGQTYISVQGNISSQDIFCEWGDESFPLIWQVPGLNFAQATGYPDRHFVLFLSLFL